MDEKDILDIVNLVKKYIKYYLSRVPAISSVKTIYRYVWRVKKQEKGIEL